jgi:tetratricopeptide (TPR) repeat protein
MSSSPTQTSSLLALIEDLYARALFVDAYRASEGYWNKSTDLTRLSVDELYLGGRLAARLGGSRLSRHLFRTALKRDPQHPRVRYFSYVFERKNWLKHFRGLETNPDLDGGDDELRSDWFGTQGEMWATVRDFDRAHACLARAQALLPDNAWVLCCEANVLGTEDRWLEALARAERAWEIRPGSIYAADALGSCLLNLGRVHESSRRLASAAKDTQSYQVIALACWHLCTACETLDGDARVAVLDEANALANRLESVAPLADREARRGFALVRLDIAGCRNDPDAVKTWAEELSAPFFTHVLDNMKRNPSGTRLRLPFRPAIQKFNACLPTSIASAVAASGGALDPDAMIADITFGGTKQWSATEWLEQHGFVVRSFLVTADLALNLIREGIAFVMSLEGDDMAHAVAVVGLDEAHGTLLVHDPNSFRLAEYLLDVLSQDPAFAFKGMAAVLPEKAALLNRLLPEDAQIATLFRRYERAIDVDGQAAAGTILHQLEARYPEHPTTRLLQIWQAREDGRMGEAFRKAKLLAQEFPTSTAVRVHLVFTCRILENQRIYRETLEHIVESGRLPGVHRDQEWVHPPVGYVCDYAELLSRSAASRPKARALLLAQLNRRLSIGQAWHTLADLLTEDSDHEGALLCYRLGSCLEPANEHYARSYANALARMGRSEEGFAWLERRARGQEGIQERPPAWISWIDALEDAGHPERALAACAEAMERHASSLDLRSCAVAFLARMGHWEDAERHLHNLEAAGHAGVFHSAAYAYFRMRGDLLKAARHADAWLEAAPRMMPARYAVLDIKTLLEGHQAAVSLALMWTRQYRGNEEMEAAYLLQLEMSRSPSWKQFSVLLRRVNRNPEDGGAWRHLANVAINVYWRASDAKRRRLRPRIQSYIEQCERLAPRQPATLAAKARWLEACGEWNAALGAWLQLIETVPSGLAFYENAWAAADRGDETERQAVWECMETHLRRTPERLVIAGNVIRLLSNRLGVAFAETRIERWRLERPDDPEVLEAAADLLLIDGHGRSDARRALVFLEPAVTRFPYHLGLALSLANAYRRLGRKSEEKRVLQDVVRRHPCEIGALFQLARIHEEQGEAAEVKRLLEAARAANPRHPLVWAELSRSLIREGRLTEGSDCVQEGLTLMPDQMNWRQDAIELLANCGDRKSAVDVAREGIRLYPQNAAAWFLLGQTLEQQSEFATQGEVEHCFRHCLALDRGFYSASDWLAMILVHQRRYEEAKQVMQATVPGLSDPSMAHGRLAWIKRMQGGKEEAYQELIHVLTKAPWFLWGWSELMTWLAGDEDWDRARTLFRALPLQLRTKVDIRRQRLGLLEQAGLKPGELDSEWDELLGDFPDNAGLHMERHDALFNQERYEEAAAVLRRVIPLYPGNAFLLARLTMILRIEGNPEEAFRTAMQVWFAPVSKSTWPATIVWEPLRSLGLADRAYEAVCDALKNGASPAAGVFPIIVSHIAERNGMVPRQPLPPWKFWLPDEGKTELLEFLQIAGPFPEGRVECLRGLTAYGYQRAVVEYWDTHRQAVNEDVNSWAEVGRALIDLDRCVEAAQVLASWPERPGVQMHVVANYVLSLLVLGTKNHETVLNACESALRGLPHDNTAKFLAYVAAEMCVRLDRRERFLEIWRVHRAYFTGRLDKGEYFHYRHVKWLPAVPAIGKSLEEGNGDVYDEVRGRLSTWQPWLRDLGAFESEASDNQPIVQAPKRNLGCLWAIIVYAIIRILSELMKL